MKRNYFPIFGQKKKKSFPLKAIESMAVFAIFMGQFFLQIRSLNFYNYMKAYDTISYNI